MLVFEPQDQIKEMDLSNDRIPLFDHNVKKCTLDVRNGVHANKHQMTQKLKLKRTQQLLLLCPNSKNAK